MADVTDQHGSNPDLDDAQSVGNGSAASESRGVKRQRPAPADDDDDDDDKGGRERRKIEIKFISDKSRRHITFSKRKAGIMKKVRTHPHANSRCPGLFRADYSHRTCLFFFCFVEGLAYLFAVRLLTCLFLICLGLRAVRPHRHAGFAAGRLGNWTGLHIHDPQIATTCYQGRRKEPDSGTLFTSRLHSRSMDRAFDITGYPKGATMATAPPCDGVNTQAET